MGKAWPSNAPSAREAEDGIQQLTPTPENNTQGLGEQMHTSNEATRRCPSTKTRFPTSKYQFFERHKRQSHAHVVFECDLAVKLHVKNVDVVTSANGNPRQDQVTMGRAHSGST